MKTFAPRTKSLRHTALVEYRKNLTRSKPHKRLVSGMKQAQGRNAFGRITSRHRGGGHKQKYRFVDFMFDKRDIPARVESVEYDPNRSSFISLVCYKDGERRYVLTPKSVKVGDTLIVSEKAPVTAGNRLPLRKIPVGTFVYNVEVKRDGGAKLVRSAGNYGELIAHDGGYAFIKLPSTEVRKISGEAWGSVGEVSNSEHKLVNLGKAGRARWLGKRPKVRGTAMNPVDHPYGGGEGVQPRGTRRAKTMWGKAVGKGQKTRTPKKYSNVFIVSRRKPGKLMRSKV
jgi:large subunit ribosomal protein L2